jgi:hypothetical protein
MTTEKQLIELDDLIDNIDWDNDLQKWTLRGEPEDIPTLKLVHGRWIQSEPGCRLCSHCMADVAIYSCHTNYCPNCGARMDGEGQ